MPLVELEERKSGFTKLDAAYKALAGELGVGEYLNRFGTWGKEVQLLVEQTESLAAEVATAESVAKKLASEAREKGVSRCYWRVGNPDSIATLGSPRIPVRAERKTASNGYTSRRRATCWMTRRRPA